MIVAWCRPRTPLTARRRSRPRRVRSCWRSSPVRCSCARDATGTSVPRVASGEGLYADDTRHLSELRLTVGGLAAGAAVLGDGVRAPRGDQRDQSGAARRGDGAPVPQETLNVRRTVLIADRLHYRVRVRNFHSREVVTTIELSLGADFADVFEVRGVDRRTSGRVLAPARDGDQVRFAYLAADDEQRERRSSSSARSPARVLIDGGAGDAGLGRGARGSARRSRWLITVIPQRAAGGTTRAPTPERCRGRARGRPRRMGGRMRAT